MMPSAHIVNPASNLLQDCEESVPPQLQHTGLQEGNRSARTKRIDQAMAMRLLTEKQVSAITAIPAGTLRRWRCTGEGPPYIKMGNGPKARVRYDAVDVLAYVEAGKRYPIRAGNTGGQHGN
jgi:predicted DNA-binding transcriptional regulator AlpA